MKQVKAGIIGCGYLGKIHCSILKSITDENKSVEFTGVFDSDKTCCSKVSAEFGIKCFESQNELFESINALIIATPTTTHFEIAMNALNYRINLFIEKPVTASLSQALMLSDNSKEKKHLIQVGHVERFNPALLSLNQINLHPLFIEAHRLAQFKARGTEVSVIHDLMIHDIDIILGIVQSPVKNISANGVKVISDSVDIANARLTFVNNCVANITSSRISLKTMRKMRIFQNNAYISVDFLNNSSEIFRLEDNEKITGSETTYPLTKDKSIVFEQTSKTPRHNYNPLKEELNSFFKSILYDEPVKVPLEDGVRALEVTDKIIRLIG